MNLPPEGWFPDPTDPQQMRWWNGAEWTEHTSRMSPLIVAPPPASATATQAKQTARRRVPVWGWILIGLGLVIAFVFLSPIVALGALAVLITAIVAVSKNTPTWLNFRSRAHAIAGIAVSAVVFFAAGSLTGAIYPTSADDRVVAAPAPSSTASSAPTPSASPTEAVKQEASAQPFAGAITTVADSSATSGLTALAVLDALEVKGRAAKTGYSRDQFGQAWLDVDRNGCDTRNDTLARDLLTPTKSGPCTVLTGLLNDPYTATTIDFQRGQGTSELVQIDHVVSLGDAWQKGAQQLTADQRATFANDPLNLLAVSGAANAQKGDGDAATWLPKNKAFRCEYIARQVSVKATYGLWVTQAERDTMVRVLADCADQVAATSAYAPVTEAAPAPVPVTPAEPAPAPVAPAQPAPAPVAPAPAPVAPAPTEVYYKNCDAVRAAGAAPIYQGQPGYASHLDRDKDGIGCDT